MEKNGTGDEEKIGKEREVEEGHDEKTTLVLKKKENKMKSLTLISAQLIFLFFLTRTTNI